MSEVTEGYRALADHARDATEKKGMETIVSGYASMYGDSSEQTEEYRKEEYASIVTAYYEIATAFYEYGWGKSFHFADRYSDESFDMSIARHEMLLGHALGLRPGMSVLDVGCGVGGPMRTMARFTGANVTGITLSHYQVARARKLNSEKSLSGLCKVVQGDFHEMPFEENTFDAAYVIEATVHSPELVRAYKEVFRVLKPGSFFSGYEWCMTDKFDASSRHHLDVRHQILQGDGLPTIEEVDTVRRAFLAAGFEIVEFKDKAPDSEVPWYKPLETNWTTLSGFKSTPLGRFMTHWMLRALETVRVMPKGTVDAHSQLLVACDGLVEGGKLGIFTPMLFFKVRKPESS